MAVAFAALAIVVPDAAPAQGLPQVIEFGFTISPEHGRVCVQRVRISFVGNNALWEPLWRQCGRTRVQRPPGEGHLYTISGRSTERVHCNVGAGRYPKMTCDSGETKTLGERTDQPYSVDRVTTNQGSFSQGRLVLAADVTEARVLSDGRAYDVRSQHRYEFQFSAGACTFAKIYSKRVEDGSDVSPVSQQPGQCQVIK